VFVQGVLWCENKPLQADRQWQFCGKQLSKKAGLWNRVPQTNAQQIISMPTSKL
jgi:hypothetical protein